MRLEEQRPWQRTCPAPHGRRAHEFWRGWGWLFLAASLLIHALILWSLPGPLPTVLRPQTDILIALEDSPPPPPPLPEPQPRPDRPTQPTARPQSEPQSEAPPTSPEPGPVSGVESEGPGAIHSGDSLPASPEPPAPPPPEPAPPSPQPEPVIDVQALLMEYAGQVKAAILAQKYYPPVAERLGHSGSVKVGFTVAADGSLAGARIKSGSGWDELDQAALEAVRRAAPFPLIPPETKRDELGLSITLNYNLN